MDMINDNSEYAHFNYHDAEEGVAIIGLGFRIPLETTTTTKKSNGNTGDDKTTENLKSSYTPNSLWNSLINKFDSVVNTNERWSENYNKLGEIKSNYASLLPLDEWKSFDPLFFGINPTEALSIDPQQRLLLKCTWEALEDAMVDPIKLRGSNTSVFIGGSTLDYKEINNDFNHAFQNIFGYSAHSLANRVSYCFDFNGQSITVDTACSSSLNAIQLGFSTIQNGTSNVSIVGGVNLLIYPEISKAFTFSGILSKSGRCNTFDASADGFVRGEGAGVVVLKNLKQAIKDGNNIYCVIKGSSSNNDGNGLSDKLNFYSPSLQSQADNIRLALKSTNGSVSPSDIDYFEAHGTGTPTGDPIELEGISMVFKDHRPSSPLLVGSIKSNIGHCEAASGVASLIKCCLMFKNQCFAPNIHFNTPNPAIKFDEWKLKVVTDPIPFDSNKRVSMAVSNFGITGSNCCLILSQYKQPHQHQNHSNNSVPSPTQSTIKYLIPFSANSVESLNQYSSIIKSNYNESQFKELVYQQIQHKSTSLYQRSVTIASNWDEFNDHINQIKSSDTKSSNMVLTSNKKDPITVFVFCGQGSQYNTMALELYNNNEIFKQSMDLIDVKFSKYYGYSVLNKLRSIADDDVISIHDPIHALPSVCMIQASLVQLYKHWGIEPSFIVGHSLGEVTAAYCSGMIDLDTFCYVVYHRSVLQSSTNGCGKMLSINISADEFKSNYSIRYPSIEIACYNSPTSIVIGGNEQQLNEISKELKEKGVFTAMLGSLSSFHTSSQLVIKDQILNLHFESKQPSIPIYSTVTTNLYDNRTKFTPEHFFEIIYNPVCFAQTISNLYKHIESNQLGNEIVFIEIAPHPTLSYYLKQMIQSSSNTSNLMNSTTNTTSNYFKDGEFISVYSPLNKKKNDIQEINQMFANLYCQNRMNINFKCQFNNEFQFNKDYLKTNNQLPHYQWDDQLYWRSALTHQKRISNGPPIDHLGIINQSSSLYKSYQSFIDVSRDPFTWLKGHVVKGKYYFPGCGYIDNLLKLYPSQDLTIDYLEFKSPFILTDGINQCLQTNIYQTGKSFYKIQFHFKESKTDQWINCSNGNFQLVNHDTFNDEQWLDIENIKNNQCNLTKLSKNELYEHIRIKTGLSYSGYFMGVEQVYLGDGCSLSLVSTKQPNHEKRRTFFNTSFLDTCLHGMIGSFNEKCLLVFEKIEKLKYYSTNVPTINSDDGTSENEFIYVYSNFNSEIGDSFSASITAALMDGTILFEIENATCKSLTPIKDSLSIEYPTNELFTPYLQSIESLIPSPTSKQFKDLYQNNEAIRRTIEFSSTKVYQQFMSRLYLKNINNRQSEITLQLIKSSTIDQLKQKYCINTKNERLFVFVFESIKQFINDENEDIKTTIELLEQQSNESNIKCYSLLLKSSAIASKLLFPLENDDATIDTPQSLFENNLLDDIYQSPLFIVQNELIGEIVQESIKPIIKEKMVFRILEFGGGTCSLSTIVLDKINQLLEQYPSNEIDIEFTWSDISSSFIPDAKNKLSEIIKTTGNGNVSIIYKVLDLEQPLIGEQQLSPSNYDIIIMSNVLHVIKDLKSGLYQLYDLLLPNGQLIFIEPCYKFILIDCIFSVFNQWWAFTDTEIRKDRCTLDQSSWRNLLTQCNFQNIETNIEIEDRLYTCLIQAQKPSLNSIVKSISTQKSNENIIVYKSLNSNDDLENKLIKELSSSNNNIVHYISNIQSFKELVKSSNVNSQTIIYFTKSLGEVDLDNFKSITLEYIQINQILLENISSTNGCKHVLLTLDSSGSNYLSSSIIGSFKYFCELPQLKIFSISLDSNSVTSNLSSSLIKYLIISNSAIRTTVKNEFIIKNNQVYFERYKQESKLKNSFKSSSFENCNNDRDNLYARLTPNLEYQLDTKQLHLDGDEIEVKIMATGINFKDYLVYACLVPSELINRLGDVSKPEIGNDFSGVVTRIGKNSQYKVGDEVYGVGYNTTASHAVVDRRYVYYKPSNISHCEAASIPSIYVTNLYSIFNVGGLDIDDDDTILIHSATGGIGLSALEILKWRGHKAPIFATVGSKEKEQYLLDHYGDIITAIYSTNNKNYSKKINKKLKEIGWRDHGVDLILNTLSGEYMDANFSCLSSHGRIVDLSVTHLNYNEYTCNNNFKYNKGYHNIELLLIRSTLVTKIIKELSIAIESGKLKLIPITEFSNMKDAIEFINQRKHIGKIVVNHQDNDMINELISKKSSESNFSLLKSNYQINDLGSNIIITGQSGIAFEILKWMVKFGSHCIDNIIILSKSSLKWELELLINKTISKPNNKIKFHFKSVDVGNTELVNNAIDEILSNNASITNIDSILHYAFTQIACKANEINLHHLDVSHGAKTMGAINLHNQSIKRGWKLLNFVMASSIASILGSEDQCSYVSACCVLDSLSKYRKSIGLPSICINYGWIASTGFVARNDSVAALVMGEGLNPISTNKILGSLDLQIQNQQQSTNLLFCDFNFKHIRGYSAEYQNPLHFKLGYHLESVISDNNNVKSQLDGKVGDLYLNKVAELLSIDVSKINTDIKLIDYGVDSLFIVQLKNWVDKDISKNIISIQQLQSTTINESIQIITTNYTNITSSLNENSSLITSNNHSIDWKNEMKLDGSIVNLIRDKIKISPTTSAMDNEPIIKRMNHDTVVLLTGSTGFLGAYLLWHFIQLSNCSKVYCLIRNKSGSANPIEEVIKNLKHHKLFNDDDAITTRLISLKVQVIVGDLSRYQLGLSDQDYSTISNNVNLIVNSGADIDLNSTYQHSKQVNVNGLKELIKLSVTNNNGDVKCIVNFSSFSVFANQKFDQEFDESTVFPSIETFKDFHVGYIQSKIVAENLLMEASSLGIPSMLIRLPSIFSNSNTGIGSNYDASLLMLQSCYSLGCYPNDIKKNLISAPIDWVADKTIKIITNENCWNVTSSNLSMNIFNVYGQSIPSIILYEYLEQEYNCKGIEFKKWLQLMNESNNQSCIKLRSFHDVEKSSENDLISNINISNKTKSILGSMNAYDEGWLVTDKMIKNHINHIFNL